MVTASQTGALYCMILFYLEARPLLEPLRPEAKLIAVKGVVFVAFWQSLVIGIAVRVGWVRGYSLLSYTAEEVAAGLQNFLICVEMALAAVLMCGLPSPRCAKTRACGSRSRACKAKGAGRGAIGALPCSYCMTWGDLL